MCLTWSHQHSPKLGSWHSSVYSKNSKPALSMCRIHMSLRMSPCQRVCAQLRRLYRSRRTHLHIPAKEMGRHKHIHLVSNVSKGSIGVIWSVDTTVLSIGPLRQWLTQAGIIELQELPGVINCLGGKGRD